MSTFLLNNLGQKLSYSTRNRNLLRILSVLLTITFGLSVFAQAPNNVAVTPSSATINQGSSVNLTASGFTSGNSAVFNGTTSKLSIPHSGSLTGFNESFTISMWIKPASMQNSGLFQKLGNVGPDVQCLGRILDDGRIQFFLDHLGIGWSSVSTAANAYQANEWTHVAFEQSKSGSNYTLRIFVNGIESQDPLNLNVFTKFNMNLAGTPLEFGVPTVITAGWFGGEMDEIRVYNAAVGATHINNLKNSTINPNTANLTAYIKLDGNANDLTAFANNATATDITYNNPGLAPLYPNYTWLPATSLNVGTGPTVSASPASTTTYTVYATNPATAEQTTVDVTVNVNPPAGALNFDGVNDYVILGNSGNNLGAITISTWIYRTGNSGSNFDEIWSKEFINSFAINNINNKLHVNFGNGIGWGAFTESNTSIPLNQWTHIAATRNLAGDVKIYINGVLDATGFNNQTGTNNLDRAIGRKMGPPAATTLFEGSIDELRIFNRELHACEITAYLNCEFTTLPAGLVNYYKCNQGFVGANNSSINYLTDETGNNSGLFVDFTLTGNASNFTTGNVSGNCSNISLPVAAYTVNEATQCFNNNSFDFTNTSTAGSAAITDYAWNIGGTNLASIDVMGFAFGTSGVKNISLQITDANGCTASATSLVTVNQNPTANVVVNNDAQCLTGNEFDFTAANSTAGSSPINSWNWVIDGNNFNTEVVNDIVFNTAGSKLFSMVVADNNGCTDTVNANVNVWEHPANANFTINDDKQCFTGNSLLFTDNTGILASKTWQFRNAIQNGLVYTHFSITPELNFNSTVFSSNAHGPFNVIFTLTNNNGCITSDTQQVFIYPDPQASFTINDNDQCLTGNSFSFTNTSTIDSGAVIYAWDFGDGTTSTVANPTKTYNTPGTYTVTLTATSVHGTCIDDYSLNVDVREHPANANFTINDDKQCLIGNSFLFTDNTGVLANKTWQIRNAIQNGLAYTHFTASPELNFNSTLFSSNVHGPFNVIFTLTSDYGCTTIDTQQIFIYPEPTASFTVNDNAQCRIGNTFTFTNTSTIDSGAVTYLWNFGDGTTSTLANPTKTYSTADTFTVTLTVTSVHGGCTDDYSLDVIVYPHPTAKIGIANELLCNRKVNFVDSSTTPWGANIVSWNWNFGDLTSSTAQNFLKDYATPGSKNVTLSVTNDFGCAASTSRTINLIQAPVASFVVNSAAQCLVNNSFIFTNQSTPVHPAWITGSKWLFGNGDTSNNTFPIPYSYPETGTYNVRLVVYSTTGCTDTASMQVTVNGANTANFSVNNPTCSQTLNFVNAQTTGSYLWNFGDGNTSTAINPTHTYAAAGNYNVKLVSFGAGCANDSITKVISVGVFPSASFTHVAGNACSDKVTFTNTSSIPTGTLNYVWDFGDGSTSTVASPTKAYNASGSYNVTLTVTSAAGCQAITSQTVNANAIAGGLSAGFTAAQAPGGCLTRFEFTNQSTGADNYVWQFHDGFSSADVNPHKTYAATGNFLVRLIALKNNGCADTAEQVITVTSATGNALKASFTTAAQAQCLGTNSFNFFNNSYNVGWGWGGTYSWDFGDGTTSAATFIFNKKYTTPGIYTVSLIATANSNGCRDTAQMAVIILPSPVADFTSATGCGNGVTFTNTSTGTSTYAWNFGNGSTSTDVNPTHTYAAGGWYFVTLTATASNGCSSTISKSVVPAGGSAPVAAFTFSENTCSKAITFTSTTNSSLAWDFGDGNTGVGSTVTHSYAAGGAYNVTLTAGTGACTNVLTQLVNAQAQTPSPDADFTLTTSGCDNDVLVTNNSTNATNYTVYVNGIVVYNGATANNYTITNAAVGTHHISVVASNGEICKDSAYQSVTIAAPPVAGFTHVNATCGGAVNFTNTSAGAVSFHWDFDDGTTSSQASPSKGYAAAGAYNVMLVAFNVNGCSDTTYATVNATTGAPLPVAGFTFANDLGSCSNKINFTNTSTGSGLSYHWNFGDGNSSTQLNPRKGYAFVGNYTVTLTVTNSAGCSASSTQMVSVNAGNGPSASFYTDQQVQCITNNRFNFYNNSQYMGTSFPGWINNYQWNFGDGSPVSNNTFVFGKTYSTPGNYTVRLVATSTDGCRDTMTLLVRVEAVPCTGSGTVSNDRPGTDINNPNTADRTTDGAVSTGIKNLAGNSTVSLYPNPNAGSFTVDLGTDKNANITVVIADMVGKTIYTNNLNAVDGKFDLNGINAANGQYLITIYNNNEVVGMKKFTIAQ